MYLWLSVLIASKVGSLVSLLALPLPFPFSLPLPLLFVSSSSSALSSTGNFSSSTEERHDDEEDCEEDASPSSPPNKSGAKERPSAANSTFARSAKVGAKSVFRTSCSTSEPAAIPGPRTKRGTWADSS